MGDSLALVPATILSAVDSPIDLPSVPVQPSIDTIADSIQTPRSMIMASIVCASCHTIETTIDDIATTIEPMLDPVAAIRPINS